MATCAYSVPDKNASGDKLYGAVICSRATSITSVTPVASKRV